MYKIGLLLICLVLQSKISYAEETNFYSYKLVDLKTSKVIAEHNPEKLMTPASTQKLITAYAALQELGDNYRFETKFSTQGKVVNKTLHGNLYITFDGNPDFSQKDLASIPGKLKEKGITKIKGNIIIDDSRFDDKYYADGWNIEDKNFAFSAPVSAIVIDQNAFTLKLKEKGSTFQLTEYSPYPKIINHVKLIQKKDPQCELELTSNDGNIYNLYGCSLKGSSPEILKIAIQNPKLWVQHLVKFYLKRDHIAFQEIKFDKTPSSAKLLFSFKSRPLNEMLKTFLQDSNNLIGEVLLKTLAARKNKVGSFKVGTKILYDFIAQQLKNKELEIQLKDGSGLSRKNLISADIFISLLKKINQEPQAIKETLLNALPSSSCNGTLKARFTDSLIINQGSILAKTGYMENTSCLVGFINDKQGKPRYAIAVMINNTLMKYKDLKTAEEKLVEQLISNNRLS
ncbi:D-alanyl-meso-diaminopimelate endopeptidase [endosymbiont of Acanthamoeba sp. UWC8]|uniref:D-alanyl-D-alanine carboxypeptidase/D-alanyl-D-alanine endopeptidase n=1 Tax=endosymbiont of Acanthamoeba sp. UWC8 TaxID=86106 RepID=UPI0004D127BE|nr:D-alanyl-D-alanine carboxypeptidase/D-alanyl-D-alanine-endopeptidase [endosymbiont of Acanthamoeba sp. UWC8]AIF80631.1 D-alanyl-meso-diaminopimelate endopeptidase [endosymbiont of Acanthamoeba sp. UWC8]